MLASLQMAKHRMDDDLKVVSDLQTCKPAWFIFTDILEKPGTWPVSDAKKRF